MEEVIPAIESADVLCRKTHLTFVGCVFFVKWGNMERHIRTALPARTPTVFVAIDKNAILLYNITITFSATAE